MSKRPEPEMQAATPVEPKTDLKLTTKRTTLKRAPKTTRKAVKATTTKATKKDEYSNPMRTATATFKIEGVTRKVVAKHFEGMKVTLIEGKGNPYVFTYEARGAAPADITKRLRGFATKHEGVTVDHIKPVK